MKIAIEGCAHGKKLFDSELDKIYSSIKQVEDKEGFKVDLLIICGDFQSLRNFGDLEQMAVPDKFKHIGNFHEYYSGKKVAPILTVFVGGNHEGSNYLWELYHGGWVCPNIYFLGFANVINIGGLRIGGLTGIFDAKHYRNGFHEVVPYMRDHVRSIYHVRAYNEFRLSQITEPLDIFISHDWPRGIYHYGNTDQLLRQKGFFEHEVKTNTLGSEVNERLLHLLKPKYWFSAHLHVKFAALVPHHEKKKGGASLTAGASSVAAVGAPVKVKNPDAIEITDSDDEADGENKKVEAVNNPDAIEIADDSDGEGEAGAEEVKNPDAIDIPDEVAAVTEAEAEPEAEKKNATGASSEDPMVVDSTNPVEEPVKVVPRYTKFLALDKCMPRRATGLSEAAGSEEQLKEGDEEKPDLADASKVATPLTISYDEEWLAIVRATDQYMSFERDPTVVLPVYEIAQEGVKKEREWIQENLLKDNADALAIPKNFVMTTAPHSHSHSIRNWMPLGQPVQNPQTVKFCETIGIKNRINAAFEVTTYVPPPPGAPAPALPSRSSSNTGIPSTSSSSRPMNPAIARGLSSLPPRPNLNLPAPKNDRNAPSADVSMGEVPVTNGFSGVNNEADERVSVAIDEMLEATAVEFGGYEREEGEE
ncbi:UNVERIFIED_CONTAM: hypothetical protein HDU68_010875, partial [Siphonaria sp. JEL0065]